MSANTTYVSGLTHPSSWIHDNDQVLLVVGMAWWYGLALVTLLFFVCSFSKLYRRPMLVQGAARVIVLCAMLGVAYMYTSARELLYERDDGVLVRTPLVLASGAIQVVLVYVGSIHCVLAPVYDRWALWLGALATAQTTLASFVPAVQQWPGWIVGAIFYIPIPFLWITQQQRSAKHTPDANVIGWTVMWLVYRSLYAALQLSGHTFAAEEGLGTTAELALTLVLHSITLVPLVYTWFASREPPAEPGHFRRERANGDSIAVDSRQLETDL